MKPSSAITEPCSGRHSPSSPIRPASSVAGSAKGLAISPGAMLAHLPPPAGAQSAAWCVPRADGTEGLSPLAHPYGVVSFVL
ncbi:hypothetical protein GUJ93_ZPchr0014g47425 [Zizania palustris]|uniref:Uncharacterized protein n=1 Tax=Zizania palustris TaxID=103762 RepID=A0A8J5THH0_ZIZPA|nr:hypothetical protein GUJ93_ZPchr0014g47425 [Zizania palustris]